MRIGGKLGRIAGLSAALILQAGCKDFLAERMVAPPNWGLGGQVSASDLEAISKGEQLRINVGPPDAVLAAFVKAPKEGTPVRGTVLVLHGFLNDHLQLEGAARSLRDAGFRTVSVDLRGHGRSTGQYITYGVQDARDMAQVTTYLQEHCGCGPTIGVFGTSYGAASALLFAGSDPRVKAVVAVAPFSTLREEAPYFGRHLMPVPGWFYSDDDYKAIVNKMGQTAGFDPDACSPRAAIEKTQAQVLLMHGNMDGIIPWEHSKEMSEAGKGHVELKVLPLQGHLGATFDLLGALQPATREWFDRHLAEAGN
jgi:pimeloyl-ACP methyl ester carboxylesterase